MRILALERENPNVSPEEFMPLLDDEAIKVWELYQEQVIREMYFRAERSLAVLMLECSDVDEAKRILSELPLVSAGLIDFDYLPLIPYSGFSRLFAD